MNIQEDRIKHFNQLLNSLPLEELQKKQTKENEKNEKDFTALKDALSKDLCVYCKNPLTHFSKYKPCFHWLLWQAKGLRKKYFEQLFIKKGYHQVDAYLRWVANTDIPCKNINDLVEEKQSSKIIETTIRYRNLEWSFSCSHGDFQGHKEKHDGKFPHYHFQMKTDDQVVINYNAFHIPFNEYDEFCFAVERGEFDRLKVGKIHGAGMQDLMENLSAEQMLDTMERAENFDDAQFSMDTLITADEGTTISGDNIANMFEEHKKTGIPMAKLIQKFSNVSTTTFISPGHGVPEISKRKPNRGKPTQQTQ